MTSLPDAATTTRTVRRQYEQYPYPLRHPSDERKRLIVTGLDDLGSINQYCFRGKRNFQQGFRALVAGGGTGDAVVYLAHQLRDTSAKVVYLDLSQASMDVARKRIEARGLGNRVQWIQGSLLDLPTMGLPPFDYVNCSGVLHHLADPPTGLAALRSVLKPDGAMGIMVYGQYGRTGVYQMQELMRLVNQPGMDEAARVDQTLAVLKNLPDSNWYRRGSTLFSADLNTNHVEAYDLFLHSQDRAYTVPQLYDFLSGAGLHLQQYSVDHRVLYNPLLLIADPELRAAVQGLPRSRQEAIAELFCGSIIKHACWATPDTERSIDRNDPQNVPFFSRFAEVYDIRKNFLACQDSKWAFNVKIAGGTQVTIAMERVPAVIRFFELIDNRRTMGEIVNLLASDYSPRPSDADIWRICHRILDLVQPYDLILLRHRSSPSVRLD